MLVQVARALALLALASMSAAGERVVLQLKWEHEFQFAGYYAAQWQGYYEAAGLDVEIVPAVDSEGRIRDVQQELLDGRADFAIGATDILLGRDQGHPLVVLAPMFQRSPGALVTLGDRKLRSLRDLSGLRVAVNPNDFITKELQALMATRVSRAPPPILVPEPLSLKTLQADKADVLLTYGLSAEYAAREAGIDVHTLEISDIDPTFFGDTLYTHERVIERSPDTVQRFIEASIQGWHYAMTHQEQMVNRIANELPRFFNPYLSSEGYNQYFADQTASLLYYPHIPIGMNDPERWQKLHQMMQSAGLTQSAYPGDRFLFRAGGSETDPVQSWASLYWLTAVLLGLVMFVWLPARYSVPMAAAALVLGLALLFESQIRERFRDQQRQDVWNQLSSIRVQLEGRINGQFALLRGVVGMIASEPDMDQRRFAEFVGGLIDQDPLLVNIAAAPDLVVRHVYPLAGNRKAIGLDYRTNLDQMPMVELARDLRRMIVAGPLDLVQGGRAIIGRAPVYLNDADREVFWGIVSAPLDFDGLIDDIGLNAPNLGLDVALRHARLAWAVGNPVIYGDEDVFAAEPVKMRVSLGAVEWDIAATPKGGWQAFPPSLGWYWPAALALALALSLAVYAAYRQFAARLRLNSEFKRNEGMLRRVSSAAEVGGWEVDLRSGCEFVADEVYRLHGMPAEVAGGASPTRWLNFYDDMNRSLVKSRIREAIDSGETQHFEVLVEREGKDDVWLRHIIEPVQVDDRVQFLHGMVQDISAIRRADETIRLQAITDPLTGLPNRSQFCKRLSAAIRTPYAREHNLAVMFIDLDHFKDINDSLGHGVGDEMLINLGRSFRSLVREGDLVARLGGDEFTIMLPGIADAESCTRIAQEIINCVQQPITIDEHQVYTSASVGISLFPQDGEDVETLLQRADQAMYAAKAAGRNTVRYFTASMQDDVDRRHTLHMKLATALKDQELDVFYQPIIDAESGLVVKCEALVRWGDISPAEFIPLAEDTGMIGELGNFVMQKACDDLAAINAELGTDICLAFNKSTREFLEESRTHHSALEKLRDQAIFPNITIEITENLLMQNSKEIVDHLNELRRAGVKIAIDDFGTGYSSLSYLQKFPVDIVKIDKSFINDIETSGDARSLAQAIISMAHSLRITVVAEGVETAGQLSILRQLGCHYLQGYYFSPALPRDRFIEFTRKHNRPYPRAIEGESSVSRNHRLAGS